MHPMFHLLPLLGVTLSVRGFGFEEVTRVAKCMSRCSTKIYDHPQEICLASCKQPVGAFDPYPQVNELATANATLHCRSADLLMIKFNPGIYVVEQSSFKGLWDFARVNIGILATFQNLTPATPYRYRFYRLLESGVSLPEITDWFETYEVNYLPQEVRELSLSEIKTDEKYRGKLQAEIEFIPAEDRSCNYNVLSWYGEHNLIQFVLNKIRDFSFKLNNLDYDQNNTIAISSNNGDYVSNTTSIVVVMPSCLKFNNNLSICAPERVEGLRAEHRYRQGRYYDVVASWNKPDHEPDNYTIQLDLLNTKAETYQISVPGNATRASFFGLELDPQYEVSIIAESSGGVSSTSWIIQTLDNELGVDGGYKLFHKILIGLSTIISIVILASVLLYQRYRRETKRFMMNYNHFEPLNQMDSSIKKVKKQLTHSYAIEGSTTPLIPDKFELCVELLELKDILGSGAYGIVRFGSLRDEFGNVKDVAVKMLRDNPSAEDVNSFHQEIIMMKTAGQHPNIVSLIGCSTLYDKPVLVVEYCCKGDLQTYLRTIWQSMVNFAFDQRTRFKLDEDLVIDSGIELYSNNSDGNEPHYQNIRTIANRLYDIHQDVEKCTENITWADLLNFGRQVATGMEYLSSNRVVHRDLAARNVLVCLDRVVKISDFGLSRDIYQENLYKKQGNGKVPVKWMAIEALTHQVYTTHSDVWSFGILLWEIVTMGAVPYPDIPTDTVLTFLKSGYRMERPSNCGVELYNIMYSCWNARPQSRPSFTTLKEKLDNLLSNCSQNEYLIMSDTLNESPDLE